MKRLTIVLVLVVVILLTATNSVKSYASSNPFIGNWKGIDQADQSNISLWIVEEGRSQGRIFNITAFDDHTGPWCPGRQGEMNAVGVREGDNVLSVSLVWWCLSSPEGDKYYFLSDTYTYDSSSGALQTIDGSLFYRTP